MFPLESLPFGIMFDLPSFCLSVCLSLPPSFPPWNLNCGSCVSLLTFVFLKSVTLMGREKKVRRLERGGELRDRQTGIQTKGGRKGEKSTYVVC